MFAPRWRWLIETDGVQMFASARRWFRRKSEYPFDISLRLFSERASLRTGAGATRARRRRDSGGGRAACGRMCVLARQRAAPVRV